MDPAGASGAAAAKMGKVRLAACEAPWHDASLAHVNWFTLRAAWSISVGKEWMSPCRLFGSLDDGNVGHVGSGPRGGHLMGGRHAHLVLFPKPQQFSAYSAGTIGVSGRPSSRRNTGRRMLATKRRSSLCTALGLRKCEANSRLISTGRQ
jgi:hypothetical protein